VSVYNRYYHKLFNQLIENRQSVNYRDSSAIVKTTIDSLIVIVLLTIDNYRDS